MAGNNQQLAKLKKELEQERKYGRAACKGDPEALRDHEDRLESLQRQIRALER